MSEQFLKLEVNNLEVLQAINELKILLTEKGKEKLTYTTKEFSELLGYQNNTNKVDELRRAGAISAIKKGQGYIFTKFAVEQFLKNYDGEDISNTKAIKLAVSKQKKRN